MICDLIKESLIVGRRRRLSGDGGKSQFAGGGIESRDGNLSCAGRTCERILARFEAARDLNIGRTNLDVARNGHPSDMNGIGRLVERPDLTKGSIVRPRRNGGNLWRGQ